MQPGLDPARLVFIDESSAATNMARRCGHGRRGECVLAAVPHGHRKTTTFIAGLRQDGLIAPLVLDGPINGESFLAYVRQFLVPCLRQGHRHHGQSQQPQGQRRARSHRGCRRHAALPAAVSSRPGKILLGSSDTMHMDAM
jgi:hypothetical protein